MAEAFTLDTVYAQMRKEIAAAGGQSAWAAKLGVSPQIVSDAINARRKPNAQVLRALGFQEVTRYVPVKASA